MKNLTIGSLIFLLIVACSNKSDSLTKNISLPESNLSKGNNTPMDNSAKIDTSNSEFKKFWTTFIQAVVENDTVSLLKMTLMPLETRGPLDSDPIIKYNQNDFAKVFQAFNKQDASTSREDETELDLLKKVEISDPEKGSFYIIQKNWARVGSIQFKKDNNQWKMYFVYLKNSTYDIINKK